MPRLVRHEKKYPNTARLLNELWRLPARSSRVFKAYVEWTGFGRRNAPGRQTTSGKEKARMSLLRSGAIRVDDDRHVMQDIPRIEITSRISGYSRYPTSDPLILLNKLFADQYETLMRIEPVDSVTGKAPDGPYIDGPTAPHPIAWYQRRARRLMESKVLHEMVHWARTLVTIQRDWTGPDDPGWRFERMAYGFDNHASSLGIGRYIKLPGQY